MRDFFISLINVWELQALTSSSTNEIAYCLSLETIRLDYTALSHSTFFRINNHDKIAFIAWKFYCEPRFSLSVYKVLGRRLDG